MAISSSRLANSARAAVGHQHTLLYGSCSWEMPRGAPFKTPPSAKVTRMPLALPYGVRRSPRRPTDKTPRGDAGLRGASGHGPGRGASPLATSTPPQKSACRTRSTRPRGGDGVRGAAHQRLTLRLSAQTSVTMAPLQLLADVLLLLAASERFLAATSARLVSSDVRSSGGGVVR
jgi:hypothetical protein